MKKGFSIFGGVICTFVCIALFFLQIIFITFNSLKVVVTKDSINEIVKSIDIKQLVLKDNDDIELYKTFESLGFDKKETDEIINSNSFKEFLNTYINNNISNILNDKETKLEYEEIEKLVNNIETEINVNFKGKQIFLRLVKEKLPEIEETINISRYIKENVNPNTLSVIKLVLSNTVNVGFIVILVLIFLLMCLLRLSVYKPLIWYGITTSISSAIMFMTFYEINAIEIIKTTDMDKSLITLLTPIIKVIRNKGLITSLIMLAIGLLMITMYYFINKNKKESNEIL